jgi:hypothetical protein
MSESIPQLTPSMDLAKIKQALSPSIDAQYQKYRSNNTDYAPRSTCNLQIPTSGGNTMLHPGESYLSFKFTPTFTITPGAGFGAVRLDSSAFSLISSIRLYHGSNELINIQNFGDLANCLLDITAGGSRTNFSNTMGCDYFGDKEEWGQVLTSGRTYGFSMCLPIPLLGSLSSDHVLPLGWMTSGDLRLQIEWQSFEKAITTQNSILVNATPVAEAVALISYNISDVFYNAKVSRLSPTVNQQLIESHGGMPVSISAVDHRCESIHLASGSAAISARLNFQFKSLKHIMFWFKNQGVDQGIAVDAAGNFGSGTSSRFSNVLNSYYVDIDGAQIPSGQVVCSADGAALPDNYKYFSNIPMQELARCYNVTDMGSFGMSNKMNYEQYGWSNPAHLETLTSFVTGIDLERAGGDTESVVYAGTDTKNSSVHLHINLGANTNAAQTLRVFSHHDVLFTLVAGSLVKSD